MNYQRSKEGPYKGCARYQLVMDRLDPATGEIKENRYIYFGRKPSALDFINHNTPGEWRVRLYEFTRDGYQEIYMARVLDGKTVSYSGHNIYRKEA